MITLSLDAPDPWATNLRLAANGWPPGVGVAEDGDATIRATLHERSEAHVAPAPWPPVAQDRARALLAAREPLAPEQLTAWVRRSVQRLPGGSRIEWAAEEQIHEVELPQDPSAVRACRREVLRLFAGSPRVDDLVLAVSELAANAVQHGSGPTTLAVSLRPGAVVIEVGDRDPIRSPTILPLQRATWSGRGMAIVDVISDSWGVLALADTKVVWCEFVGVGAPDR